MRLRGADGNKLLIGFAFHCMKVYGTQYVSCNGANTSGNLRSTLAVWSHRHGVTELPRRHVQFSIWNAAVLFSAENPVDVKLTFCER